MRIENNHTLDSKNLYMKQVLFTQKPLFTQSQLHQNLYKFQNHKSFISKKSKPNRPDALLFWVVARPRHYIIRIRDVAIKHIPIMPITIAAPVVLSPNRLPSNIMAAPVNANIIPNTNLIKDHFLFFSIFN